MTQINKSRKPEKPQTRSSKPIHTHKPVTPRQYSNPPLWARGPLGLIQLRLSKLYISKLREAKRQLNLPLGQKKPFAEVYMHGGLVRTTSRSDAHNQLEEVNIHQAIDQSSGGLIIYGEPGAGKSALLHYLIYRALWPNDRRIDPSMRFIRGQRPGAWFPLVVDLHDDQVREGICLIFGNGNAKSEENAENFCKWLLSFTLFKSYNLSPTQIASLTDWMTVLEGQDRRLRYIYLLYKILKQKIFQKALIILDGLEQVTESMDNVKGKFLQAMNDFAEKYCFTDAEHACLLLATSRYTEGPSLKWHTDWVYWELAPLTLNKKRKTNYLERVLPSDARIDDIADELSANPRIANFTGNPLVLSIVAYLNYRKPGDANSHIDTFYHGDLYEAFVEEMWKRGRAGNPVPICLDEAKRMLGSLAYQMLNQDSHFLVSRSDLDRYIQEALKNKGRESSIDMREQIWRHITDDNCAALLSRFPPQTLGRIEKWIGKLLGLSFHEERPQNSTRDKYAFRHFTIQEYFAYCNLLECENSVTQRELYDWFCDPWWHGVLIHYLSRQRNVLQIIEGDLLALPENRTIQTAKRILATLEEQAAGYTALTIPVPLKLELEKKRKEVDDLTASLRSRTEHLSPATQMRMEFVLMQVLHTHKQIYKREIETVQHVSEHFQRVSHDIVQKTLRLVEQAPDLEWRYIPDVTSIGLGELLASSDKWRLVMGLLAPDKPTPVRVCATRFCGKIGGEIAVDVLLDYLDDSNQSVQEAAVQALQDLIDQAEDKIYAIVCDESIAVHKRRSAIRVMHASKKVKYLRELIDFGVTNADLRQDLQKTVVGIAYDQYRDQLNHMLLIHFKEDPLDEKYRFVFEALVETQDSIVTALSCRLTNPYPCWFCIQDSIIAVLSARGSHYENLNYIDQSYRSLLTSLLLTETIEHVRLALRILYETGAVWSAELVEDIYRQALPVERRRFCSHIRYLHKKDRDKDYMILIENVLPILSLHRFVGLKKIRSERVS